MLYLVEWCGSEAAAKGSIALKLPQLLRIEHLYIF